MADDHYSEEALLAFLDDNAEVVDVERVRTHVAQCDACADTVEDLRRWSIFLTHAATWTETLRSDGATALANLGARVAADEVAAEAFLGSLPRAVDGWGASVAARPDLVSVGLATQLTQEGRKLLNAAPADALVVFGLARSVLQRVAPPDLRAEADVWRQEANALRLLGRYNDALAALDEAARRYRAFPACAYDLAFVDWSRATVLFARKEFAEARTTIRRAVAAFRAHKDTMHLAQVRILEGSILFDEGDVDGARTVFLATLPILAALGDEESFARVLANLSGCEIRLGLLPEAREHCATASALYDQLDMGAEAVRLHWSVGEALTRLGHADDALAALRTAAARFEDLGMLGEAAAVGLDTANLLVSRGAFAEASALCARLLKFFREQGANADAAHALEHLYRALRMEQADTELLTYLRTYVDARLAGEQMPFQPPTDVN